VNTAQAASAATPPAPSRKSRPLTTLHVVRTEQLSPHMVRIVVGGPGFASFVPKDFTDMYVKILFPHPDAPAIDAVELAALREQLPREQWPVTRTYTVRWVDVPAQELAIDFVVHGDEGLAGPWAARAVAGDSITFSGPGGAYSPDPDADWHLFAGDDAALPAIAAAVETLPETATGYAYVEVDTPADIQEFRTPAGLSVVWLFREGATPAASSLLMDAVANSPWPEGRVSVFAHGEREYMKGLRDILFKQRGLERAQVSLSGYWAYGRTEDFFQAEKKQPIGQIL